MSLPENVWHLHSVFCFVDHRSRFPSVSGWGSELGQAGCCMCRPSPICSILSSDGAWGLQRNGWYALLHYCQLRCAAESGQEAGEPFIVKAVGAGRRSRASLSLAERQHTTSCGQWRVSSELRRSFKRCLRNPEVTSVQISLAQRGRDTRQTWGFLLFLHNNKHWASVFELKPMQNNEEVFSAWPA